MARVIVEGRDGPVGVAFKTAAYPMVLTVDRSDEGRLVVTANDVALERPAVAVA